MSKTFNKIYVPICFFKHKQQTIGCRCCINWATIFQDKYNKSTLNLNFKSNLTILFWNNNILSLCDFLHYYQNHKYWYHACLLKRRDEHQRATEVGRADPLVVSQQGGVKASPRPQWPVKFVVFQWPTAQSYQEHGTSNTNKFVLVSLRRIIFRVNLFYRKCVSSISVS